MRGTVSSTVIEAALPLREDSCTRSSSKRRCASSREIERPLWFERRLEVEVCVRKFGIAEGVALGGIMSSAGVSA